MADYFDKSFEDAFQKFDWTTVQKAMANQNWTWSDLKGVPTVHDLQVHARRLWDSARTKGHESISSGGLEVGIERESSYDQGTVYISFVYTEYAHVEAV